MTSDAPDDSTSSGSMSPVRDAGAPPRSKLMTFAVRAASAIVLIAVIAITLAWCQPAFIVLIAAMITLGVIELRNAAHRVKIEPTWQIIAVAAPVIMIGSYVAARLADEPMIMMVITVPTAMIITALIILGWRLRRGVQGYLADAGMSLLMLVYLPGLAVFVVAMMVSAHPIELVVSYAVCIAANDSGAYLLGSALGRHKMVPSISPAKTWEGFAGGVIVAGIVGALFGGLLLHSGAWQGAVFGIVLAVCATIGDLVESAIKRDAGVKDSGRFLPGHGGVLDRVDSMVYCAPVAFLCYALMGVL